MQYGHFDEQNREYVIDRVDLPVSWPNYLGVEKMCGGVNHTAGGYLFYDFLLIFIFGSHPFARNRAAQEPADGSF